MARYAYSVGTFAKMPPERVIVQWTMFPNLFRFEVFRFSDVIEGGVKAGMISSIRIRGSGATFKLQMRKDVVPQAGTGICTLKIRDRVCETAVEFRFDTISRSHALVETVP